MRKYYYVLRYRNSVPADSFGHGVQIPLWYLKFKVKNVKEIIKDFGFKYEIFC